MGESGPEPAFLTPQEVLFRYFGELLALNHFAMAEAEAARQIGRDMDVEDLRARRAAILERYCTKRRRKTDNVVSYGPLETMANDAANIVIERESQESKSRVAIYVHNTVLRERWKFLLVFQQGCWRIDSVQFRDGRKWATVPLH